MAQKLIDETGNKYGSLTVLYKTKDKNNRTAWMCKCDCGNTKIARGSDLPVVESLLVGKVVLIKQKEVRFIKMKQGVGRLIRNEEDKGIVMILDGRIVKKGYRFMMFSSLPDGYYPEDTMVENIPSKIENFLY